MPKLNHLFPISHQHTHLNHAAVSPWPRATTEAVMKFAEENMLHGSSNYLQWQNTEQQLRDRAAQLLNAASSDEIALVKNTSEGISFVAAGLQWNKGDNVVGIRQEFPSNRFSWMALEPQGVEFRTLDLESLKDSPEAGLISLCDENTRLLAISAVQFGNGLKLDLNRLGTFCRANNILFCVDAIQQLGALPFDVQACKADFAIADGHKWLLGPEGLGIFYIRRELLNTLQLTQHGWHMVKDVGNYSRQDFDPATSARRFECGSPNMLGIHALNTSLELLLNEGINTIADEILERTSLIADGLSSNANIKILSDLSSHRRSGIITFTQRKGDDKKLYKHLQSKQVLCAMRGGGIRLSPHFYTPKEQIFQTLEEIEKGPYT